MRELARQRWQQLRGRATTAHRLQNMLNDGNIKLASVAADTMGKSGRAMLEALMAGQQDAMALAGLALGPLRAKRCF